MEDYPPHGLKRCRRQDCNFLPQLNSISVGLIGSEARLSKEQYDFLFLQDCAKCDPVEYEGTICLCCQHLRLHHLLICVPEVEPGLEFHIPYASFERVEQSPDCHLCRVIHQALLFEAIAGAVHPSFLESSSEEGSVTLHFRPSTGDSIFAANWTKEIEQGLWMTMEATIHFYKGKGTATNADSLALGPSAFGASRVVSWKRVQERISDCLKNHHHANQTRSLPPGFMVLDIASGCIVEPPKEFQYIALSYVWGPQQPGYLELNRQTESDLRTPRSLDTKQVPRTIRDTMTACTELGVRYLWVDRLCIIQDEDHPQKMAQIRSMDAVYASAYLTICAVHGIDSEIGLLGLSSNPRRFSQEPVPVSGLLITPQLPSPISGRETWWTRGWVCQEYLLSPRKLLFSQWQTAFQCPNGLSTEGPSNTAATQPTTASETDDHPFSRYAAFIQEYNKRSLTNRSDIYNAILGIFAHTYGSTDSFRNGLPERDFDEALLWETRHRDTQPHVIAPYVRAGNCGSLRLPSWSWVGAEGETSFDQPFHGALARWMHASGGQSTGFRTIVATGGGGWHTYTDSHSLLPVDIHPRYSKQVYLAAAWMFGLFECAVPAEIQHLAADFDSLQHLLDARWPRYEDFWMEVHGNDGALARWLEADTQAGAALRGTDGAVAGRAMIGVGMLDQCGRAPFICDGDGLVVGMCSPDDFVEAPPVWTALEFVALSVGEQRYVRIFDQLFRQARGLGCGGAVKESWVEEFAGDVESRVYESEEENMERKRRIMSSQVTIHDGEGRPLLPPPVVNVMLIRRHNGIATRVGLGWVLLTQWLRLKPKFENFILC